MDLKLKRLLEQAQFTKYKGRGYDAAEVDDFLDRATAMAAKVEVQLTEALGRSGPAPSAEDASPSAPEGPSPEEIEAEIERRVSARVAEMPPPPAAAPVDEEAAKVDEEAANRAAEASAEEARRTLLLAQRTADAVVREARQDADQLLADAREESEPLVAEAEAHAAELRAGAEEYGERVRGDADADARRHRNAAREQLAGEIGDLEQAREALRSDAHILERHVDAQRDKVGSAIAELQRLLDDPDAIRLSPAPEVEAEVPEFHDDPEPELPAIEPVAPEATDEPAAEDPADAERADDEPGEDRAQTESVDESDRTDPSAFLSPPPTPRRGTSGFIGVPAESAMVVDHDAPGADAGPPTAPVDVVVDLDASDTDEDTAAPSPSDPSSTDDAFLAELRKAMADEEPLGPRDALTSAPADLFGDDRPRRFGRRR